MVIIIILKTFRVEKARKMLLHIFSQSWLFVLAVVVGEGGGDGGSSNVLITQPMRAPCPPGGQLPTASPMTGQMAPPPGPAPVRPPPPGVSPTPPRPQQQAPGAPGAPQPKQNRVTTMPRPHGLDPILVLQERENR